MSQKKAPLFEIRSGTVDALLLSPRTADMDALAAELTRRFADTPEFFSNDVIAIDVRRLAADERLPIDRLVETLTGLRARAIGVVASPEQAEWAQACGLPLLDSHGRRPRGERSEEAAEAVPAAAEPVPAPAASPAPPVEAVAMQPGAMIIEKPLRSGQRVYARGDLVVLDLVSDGAEVIAEGNIYVYASLRGRALAGVKGNLDARIFCTCLEPQLISIAGIYRTGETPWPEAFASKPAQIRLSENTLVLEPLRMK
ncbi:septum site-determining protein MinC [Ralstonia pseudosolanacearum]|uniref:Probable septum site-determining protein MinC n=13 Tax=Ralstonia solanacearum species complex TaxID=3116862 RepID=MINC_RALN1|nr:MULTISPECIES: septum site-determining protein MinC [Ralstonia]Q8XU30.1 RecName: Full=Probable septum site-determining protein MinC [Ralstonia pseudosolanacearum GMI1000]ANH31274.1 septation inhibitor protein [Ralstonia solanacearum]APC70067.1 septum site-determining protein MinC [Ralstonia solanacearum OE1-1]ARS57712.1 septum site-determining protein MinC [Ralstonia solanacearum FJAT-91]ESS51832.1 septum formation inhibitor [Ralstonia solanacearum SD54]AGH85924.1 Septum site-determining pr